MTTSAPSGAAGRRIVVDDADDPRLAVFRRNERALADRAARRDDGGAGLFLAEGDLVVERALAAGCRPVAVLVDAGAGSGAVPRVVDTVLASGVDVLLAGEAVRRAVTGLGMVHPVVALFERPPRPGADELVGASRRLVVAVGVDNPANVGGLVRNAAALGWDSLLLDHTSADPLSRRAIRVAMGTVFTLPHARTTALHDVVVRALAAGTEVLALTPDPDAIDITGLAGLLSERHPGGPTVRAVTVRRALLVGSERDGLPADLLDLATHRVRIPMTGGVDSLNAAAATAIACHVLR